jgi:hypothetical protein
MLTHTDQQGTDITTKSTGVTTIGFANQYIMVTTVIMVIMATTMVDTIFNTMVGTLVTANTKTITKQSTENLQNIVVMIIQKLSDTKISLDT